MYKLITAPESEPVDSDELKSQLRITTSDQDTMLDHLIMVARQWAEDFLRFQIMTATWELYLDEFPESGKCIYIQKSPVSSITSLTYTDTSGSSQTLTEDTDFIKDIVSMPARLYEAYSKTWPDTREIQNAVVIKFVAGYASLTNQPHAELIKQAVLLRAASLYENATEEVTGTQVSKLGLTAERLLWPIRAMRF